MQVHSVVCNRWIAGKCQFHRSFHLAPQPRTPAEPEARTCCRKDEKIGRHDGRTPLSYPSCVAPPGFQLDFSVPWFRVHCVVSEAASFVAHCTLHIANQDPPCVRSRKPTEQGSCRRRWESSCRRGIEQAKQDRSAGPFLRGETNMPSSHLPIKKYNYER